MAIFVNSCKDAGAHIELNDRSTGPRTRLGADIVYCRGCNTWCATSKGATKGASWTKWKPQPTKATPGQILSRGYTTLTGAPEAERGQYDEYKVPAPTIDTSEPEEPWYS